MSSPLASIQNKTPSAMGVMTRLACNRAKEEGVEVAPLLQKAGLTREQIDDHSARVDVKRQIKFLDLMAAELNDELLGFHLAQNYDLRLIGLLYYTQASSDSIGEALRRAARYSSIVNESIALRLRQGRDIAIRFEYRGVARRTDQHQIEFAMVTFVRICRQLTNRHLSATKVSFTHPRNNEAGKFNNFFGCSVTFGATDDQLCFSGSIKELPIAHADSYLNELLTGYCEQALADRETRQSPFALSVENAVTLLLPHGNAGANEIARKLGVSRRTLARRLSAEGLTFAAVLKNLKRDLAKRHLADDTLSISEIAWLLGYQDVSAFTHAFKRWTGTSPRLSRHASRSSRSGLPA
jgi:AraC-like DNA-binding protein